MAVLFIIKKVEAVDGANFWVGYGSFSLVG